MASYLPPTDNLPIFNPTVFQSGDDTGITLSEADARFVKKSGSIMTGALTTTSLTATSINLGAVDVGNELNKISSIETATTGITYDNTNDITTIDNNVTINNDLIVGTTNIGSSISTIENDVTDLETATTGITYDNTGNIDLTTIDNNVTINNNLSLPSHSDVDQAITDLETATTGITYASGSDTTTIDNNVTINNDLIVGSTNIGSTVSTLVTNTSGITYAIGSDTTTIDNNVTINNNLIVGSTNIGSSISTPSNFITAGTDLEWSGSTLNFTGGSNTTGITYDDTAGADLTTISNNVTITKNVEVESNLLLTGSEKVLGVDDSGVGYIKLKNLNDDGVLQFNNTNDKLFFQNQTTSIMSIESDQVKIFQCLTTNDSALDIGDTTTRFNTGYFSTINTSTQIDTPEVRSQVFRANTSSDMEFQNESGTKNMVLTTQGKLGIQTAADTPTHDLTVVGDAAITDDLTVTGSISAGGGIYSKTMIFNDNGSAYDSNITGGDYGNDAYFRDFGTSGQKYIIGTFGSMSSGIFTFSSTGTYKVEVNLTVNTHNTNYPNAQRYTFGCYISVNNEVAVRNPFKVSNRGRLGCIYIRDNNDGLGGSCYMQDYIHVSGADTIRIKTLVDNDDSDNSFDDILTNNKLDSKILLIITQICETTNILQTP